MYGLRQLAVPLLAWAVMARALDVAPTNASITVAAQIGLFVNDSPDSPMSSTPLAMVINLSQSAGDLLPPGIAGTLVPATPDNQLNLTQRDVALISCDPQDYPGQIKPIDVYGTAETKNVTAVVFYSQHSNRCILSGAGDLYNMTFSMESPNDTSALMAKIQAAKDKRLFAVIRPANNGTSGGQSSPAPAPSTPGSGSGSNNQGQQQGWEGPGGPTPSTAVAMIILYSITGVITAMFLAIIVTGAIRAHRHPERYGPRNVIGATRQSRARGLAKAMLETLPVVKFGDKDSAAKPTEVELENGVTRTTETGEVAATPAATSPEGAVPVSAAAENPSADAGIAAADGVAQSTVDAAPTVPESQGCSICTDDFEIGQDQRVLPCDHRFHPACVDPWLLNVSGTCPLCRIDLRGESAETEESTEENSTDSPLSPPMTNDRNSTRRSLMLTMMGLNRPDRMSREERVQALRQYRARQDAEATAPVENDAVLGQQEQSAMRRTLRRVLRRSSHAPPTTNTATPAPTTTTTTTTTEGSNDTAPSQPQS